jgi:SAM-dependent MidA family methyltransferase
MSLTERLIARIAREGAISVADYMDVCLHDPEAGYYACRPALGAQGDFITAPHVSQIFGELIGLWAADVWARLGSPPRLRLVEIGPGDGTLLTDLLRAVRAAPGFLAAIDLWLVETSEPLRRLQAKATARAGVSANWATRVDEIPLGAPIVAIGNEFLDCLPIRQAVWTPSGWRERRVGLSPTGALAFEATALVTTPLRGGTVGDVWEWSPALKAYGRGIGALIARASGAALFMDYGRAAPGPGDTLQALRGHRKEGALATPGGADLTAHVDFPAFLAAAKAGGALTSPLLTQGEFLRRLGIEARADMLATAHPARAGVIGRQLERLIGAEHMGALFKAAVLCSPGLAPPGFDAP